MKTSIGNQDEDLDGWSDDEYRRRERIIDAAAAQLAEHFDLVQIVATQDCPMNGTTHHCAGNGNVFARIALVDKWSRDTLR